jgi:hypothetical protein
MGDARCVYALSERFNRGGSDGGDSFAEAYALRSDTLLTQRDRHIVDERSGCIVIIRPLAHFMQDSRHIVANSPPCAQPGGGAARSNHGAGSFSSLQPSRCVARASANVCPVSQNTMLDWPRGVEADIRGRPPSSKKSERPQQGVREAPVGRPSQLFRTLSERSS